jgi:hypothetical protein
MRFGTVFREEEYLTLPIPGHARLVVCSVVDFFNPCGGEWP